jgi:hypothetical protein
MSFPIGPVNNQTATVNGITYVYSSANNAWTRVTATNLTLAGNLTTGGNVTIAGNLTVQGNTTTLNTETLTVEDLNITVANGAASSAAADGAGLTVAGANARLLYKSATDSWVFDRGVFASGNLVANSGTTSSSTTTGALVVAGGMGISNDIVAGGAIIPGTDNTGFIGNTTNTWANGQFTNLTVDSTLSVRGAVDLADNDILRLGSGDDWEFFHDGTDNYIDLNVGNLIIRDNTTQRASFSRTTGNLVLDSTTASTSTTTGALVVKGGAGIAGTLYTGVLNINGAYQFPTTDGQYSGQVLTTNGSGTLTFANVSGGGGGATGFPQSTVTTYPTGDYGTGEPAGVGTGSATLDAFEVPLGALFDNHEPRGSTTTVDLNT